MPKPTKGPRIGGSPAHQRIILANLASQLFEHGRITTTQTRAKRVQPLAEKLISQAKRGDLATRRLVMKTITDQSVVHKLFTEIAPSQQERPGGYTRVLKIGPRKGDNAPMVVLELVTEEYVPKPKAEPVVAEPEPVEEVTEEATEEVVEADAEETAEADAAEEVAEEVAEPEAETKE